ncbi:MAG: FtsX-like permease family protein [Bacteroidota bacterium]|nr:FtsX-like permease family protein [Bacteroidota bacterium]
MYLKFAWRYFKAKKSTHAINIISWVTAGVIAFSTMCQVLVLSVFNGFEDLVKSLYSNFYADVKVVPAMGKTFILTQSQLNEIHQLPGIKGLSLEVEEKALLQNGDQQTVVLLKGVDSNYNKVSGVPQKMFDGVFNTGTIDHPKLVLGAGIEDAIGVQADRNLFPLTIFLPKKSDHAITNPLSILSEGNATTSGSFAIQQDFDNKYVITNIGFVKQQMNYKVNEYSALEISLTDPGQSESFTKKLQNTLRGKYKVLTKYEQNTSLYNSMRLEKWFIYAVLTLILIIAAFNMVGALTMLVLEKRKDISVLQALGADKSLVKKIFLSEGILLAVTGAGTGIILALIITLLQLKFHLIKLVGNSFLIDYFPVKLVITDFVLVVCTSLIIAFLASWFPAKKASEQMFNLKS